MQYVAILKFKGKVIMRLALHQDQPTVALYVTEYGHMTNWIDEGKPPALNDRVKLYKMVFDYVKNLYVDEARQIEFNEYEFAGILQ